MMAATRTGHPSAAAPLPSSLIVRVTLVAPSSSRDAWLARSRPSGQFVIDFHFANMAFVQPQRTCEHGCFIICFSQCALK